MGRWARVLASVSLRGGGRGVRSRDIVRWYYILPLGLFIVFFDVGKDECGNWYVFTLGFNDV